MNDNHPATVAGLSRLGSLRLHQEKEMEPRVVVVTGASSGIGAALAEELGRRGAFLVDAAIGEGP